MGLLFKKKRNKNKQHTNQEEKTRKDKKRQEKTRKDKKRQDKKRQEKTRKDKKRQEKTRKDKKRQEKTRKDKKRQSEISKALIKMFILLENKNKDLVKPSGFLCWVVLGVSSTSKVSKFNESGKM
jgi:flagellar biosynthesis GTPase FlhF